MVIGERLRELREDKDLSQGDIEQRTGLLRCYISRVENGHTVPAIETLEKMARALEVLMYQLFYDGDKPPKPLNVMKGIAGASEWGESGKDQKLLNRFRVFLGKASERDRKTLLYMAQKMARPVSGGRKSASR